MKHKNTCIITVPSSMSVKELAEKYKDRLTITGTYSNRAQADLTTEEAATLREDIPGIIVEVAIPHSFKGGKK